MHGDGVNRAMLAGGWGWSRRRFLGTAAGVATGSMVAGPRGLLAQNASAPGDSVMVSAPCGRLRGAMEAGVRVYRGVPFAEPPVGPLRFRPTVAAKAWAGVREATAFRPAAMQEPQKGLAMSEDCLYLNVWAPVGRGPWPVFVWIHGGGYTGGNAFAPIFDGAGFAAAGVVLVTVAYRLGVFGFMDLSPLLGESYTDSANNGTRDLVQSIRWVHENIAAFGGDPERVTVGGESAGAKSTGALLAIPEASAIFQSGISESGGGERVLTREQARVVAEGYRAQWAADAGGGRTEDLRTAPAAALIAAQARYMQATPMHFPFRVEVGPLPGGGALLPGRPVDLLAAGTVPVRGKRLLIGTNRDESALFLPPHPEPPVTKRDLGNLSGAAFDPVFAKYSQVYPEMTESQREIRALTAEEYWVPSVRLADAVADHGGEVWMYELEFALASGRYAGEAYHSEDLGFVWDRLSDAEKAVSGASMLARQMHGAWVAFVRGKAPGAAGLPDWPSYTAGRRATMMLNVTSRVEERPQDRELQLWDGVM